MPTPEPAEFPQLNEGAALIDGLLRVKHLAANVLRYCWESSSSPP